LPPPSHLRCNRPGLRRLTVPPPEPTICWMPVVLRWNRTWVPALMPTLCCPTMSGRLKRHLTGNMKAPLTVPLVAQRLVVPVDTLLSHYLRVGPLRVVSCLASKT
jgi:hypothetical protein